MTLLSVFKVSGHSMEPTINNQQVVLVSSLPFVFKNPRIGDIVLFVYQDKTFVKRINKIEEDKYFLIGDNTKDSTDSRKIGWIARTDILGKVILEL